MGIRINFCNAINPDDINTVSIAVFQNDAALEYASDRLKKNKWVVGDVLCRNVMALQYASDALKADDKIVQKATYQNPIALQFASQKLELKYRSLLLDAMCLNVKNFKLLKNKILRDDRELVDIVNKQILKEKKGKNKFFENVTSYLHPKDVANTKHASQIYFNIESTEQIRSEPVRNEGIGFFFFDEELVQREIRTIKENEFKANSWKACDFYLQELL